jgi:hypothetical protein
MSLTPLPAAKALDAYFLEARCKLLDLAAILDRIDRGGGVNDPRLESVHRAIGALTKGGDRAEQIQTIFSLPYDPGWKRPAPR